VRLILNFLSKFPDLVTVLLLTEEKKQQRECSDEIKHGDKLPSSSPSQACLLNKHCRLDSLELQSLHPESPYRSPRRFLQAGKKRNWREKTAMEKQRKRRGEKKPERQG